MKIGAVMFFTTESMQPAPLARAMEERGFESLWVPEHTHIPSSLRSAYPASGGLVRAYYELMDPFLALNTAATVTTNLKVGTGIVLITQRDGGLEKTAYALVTDLVTVIRRLGQGPVS